MHFSNFENLKLVIDDQIIITNAQGNALHGIFKDKYSWTEGGTFDFLNFNGSKIERMYLINIQHVQKNK